MNKEEILEYAKDVAINFSNWLDGLSRTKRCSVWPQAGSGSGIGLYERTKEDLFQEWFNQQEQNRKAFEEQQRNSEWTHGRGPLDTD